MEPFEQKKQVSFEKPYNMWEAESYDFPPHWHDEFELIYLMEGEHSYLIEKKQYNVKKGDLLIIGPCMVHQYLENYYHNKAITFQFNDYLYMKNSTMNIQIKNPHIKNNLSNPTYVKLKKLVEDSIEEYKEKKEGFEFAIETNTRKMLLIILREIKWKNIDSYKNNSRRKKLERLEKVFEFIDDHYYENITLEKAALICNFSKYHFSRFFKEATGMTFKKYLDHIRLEKSKKFLLKTEATVTEIAVSCGFSSINSFERSFKKSTNKTPSEFREKFFSNK